MVRWIPVLASVGLVSLMLVPPPGVWGLLISLTCSVAIVVAILLWLLDRIASRVARLWDRKTARRRLHAGSNTIRTSGAPPPPAPVEPPRPSPVQVRAQAAALRREAGQLEPFRLR